MTRAFFVVNPVAGTSEAEEVKENIRRHCDKAGWNCEIHETSSGEEIGKVIRETQGEGFDLFVACGGDGTVSGVVEGLVHAEQPMGIVPTGTGNVFAQDLGIPRNIDEALELITGDHNIRPIDVMRIGDRYFVLNIAIGLSSKTMQATSRDQKRRLGLLAYLWTGTKKLVGIQPHRFVLEFDGETYVTKASELVVANSGALGTSLIRVRSDVRPDDGRLEVCFLEGHTLFDYGRAGINLLLGRQRQDPNIRCLETRKGVTIRADETLPVEGDGENIGETPIHIEIDAQALRVIVPPEE